MLRDQGPSHIGNHMIVLDLSVAHRALCRKTLQMSCCFHVSECLTCVCVAAWAISLKWDLYHD